MILFHSRCPFNPRLLSKYYKLWHGKRDLMTYKNIDLLIASEYRFVVAEV